MIVKGSMGFTPSGRKRKKFKAPKKKKREFVPLDRAVVPSYEYMLWEKNQREQYPSVGFTPDPQYGKHKKEDYRAEVSKKYTISVAYNKGAYQVIPQDDVENIGK